MKILALSQIYWPDTASVSQHLTDLLEELASRGHSVTVISSQIDYENPQIKFKQKENRNSVKIIRVPITRFGKKNKISRMIDFLSFNVMLLIKLIFYPRHNVDVILGLTAPPLVSYIGAKYAQTIEKKFVYWTMDLQPELSIVAGYILKQSRTAKALEKKGDYIFRNSNLIVALDRYMSDHIQKRVDRTEQLEIIPVWPVMGEIYDGLRANNPFRVKNKFSDKIVVMYSGNHSVMHPLTTLLDAAVSLRDDSRFLFVHIGSGVRLQEVKDYKINHSLDNIVILPYQPRDTIHYSLGSADIQVVALGDGCVGYTHPNKIYGAMFIGKPILYIGPRPSHITDILDDCADNISVEHGDSNELVSRLHLFAELDQQSRDEIGNNNRKYAEKYFRPSTLIDQIVSAIEAM